MKRIMNNNNWVFLVGYKCTRCCHVVFFERVWICLVFSGLRARFMPCGNWMDSLVVSHLRGRVVTCCSAFSQSEARF